MITIPFALVLYLIMVYITHEIDPKKWSGKIKLLIVAILCGWVYFLLHWYGHLEKTIIAP